MTSGGGEDVESLKARLVEARAEIEQQEKEHLETIDERDLAEHSISHAYFLVTGHSPEWSNNFGHDEALEEIKDGLGLLRQTVKSQEAKLDRLEKVLYYAQHDDMCIFSYWEAGEPTPEGGYRMKYKGKWYQSKPVDETPKCECGLDDLIARVEEETI